MSRPTKVPCNKIGVFFILKAHKILDWRVFNPHKRAMMSQILIFRERRQAPCWLRQCAHVSIRLHPNTDTRIHLQVVCGIRSSALSLRVCTVVGIHAQYMGYTVAYFSIYIFTWNPSLLMLSVRTPVRNIDRLMQGIVGTRRRKRNYSPCETNVRISFQACSVREISWLPFIVFPTL